MSDDGEAEDASVIGRLFNGMRFFVLQRVPARSHLLDDIKQYGGSTVKLEAQATHVIADDLKRDSPNGSVSWKFIEAAIKEGALPDIDRFIIHTNTGALRTVGSTVVHGKKTKSTYTAVEDAALNAYVYDSFTRGGKVSVKGNKMWQEYGMKNFRHSWQSYRDRYLKYLATPEVLAGGIPAPAIAPQDPSTTATTIPNTAPAETYAPPVSCVEIVQPPRDIATVVQSQVVVDTRSDDGEPQDAPTATASRGRVAFSADEDILIWRYVMSQPPEKRSGNNIYRTFAKAHTNHSWQSWRDRYVKRLKLSPPVSTDEAAQLSESPPEKRARIPYTVADDLAIWQYVQTVDEGSVGGNIIYQKFAENNGRHSWRSWRDRYLKMLVHNPPAGAVLVERTIKKTRPAAQARVSEHHVANQDRSHASSGFVDLSSLDGAADSRVVYPRVDTLTGQPNEGDMRRHIAAQTLQQLARPDGHSNAHNLSHEPTAAATVLDPSLHGPDATQLSPEMARLNQEQQTILAGVMQRRPVDSQGDFFSELEVSHLIMNMPDLDTESLDSEDLACWVDWVAKVESRTAEDWRDLYHQHVVPVASERNLEHSLLGSHRGSDAGSSHYALLPATITKRGLESSPTPVVKKRRIESIAYIGSGLRQASVVSDPSNRSREQMHASHQRTSWLFEQASHRRQAEASMRSSPASDIAGGNRLTMANLAAQSTRIGNVPPQVSQRASYLNDQRASKEPDRSEAEASLATPPAELEEAVSQLPSQIPDTYDINVSDAQIADAKYMPPPKQHTQHDTTSPRTEGTSQQSSYELDLDMLSPPPPQAKHVQAQQNLPSNDAKQAHQANLTDVSLQQDAQIAWASSPPLSLPMQSRADTHPSPHSLRAMVARPTHSKTSTSSDAFQSLGLSVERVPIRRQVMNTQAILDLQTQPDDFTMPEPDLAFSQAAQAATANIAPRMLSARQDDVETWIASAQSAASQPESMTNSQEALEDFVSKFQQQGFAPRAIGYALFQTSGRPELAAALLTEEKRGRVYKPNANWRWTREEDDVLEGGDARAIKRLQDIHGQFEYNIRMQYLFDYGSRDGVQY